jgi:spermidine/putrescine transport system substrate-binding protein
MADRDLDDMLRRMSQTKVNRRGFLAAAGLTGTAAALAACGPGGAGSAAPASIAPVASGSATPSAAAVETAAPSFEIEKELFMYNWAAYVSPDNMDKFKAEFGVETFTYDVYDNNEVLIAKLQGGASGYDIAAPTAEYVPGMVDEGFLQKLDLSRIPNLEFINKTFKDLWWDPTNEYQVPKDYGTTGILYMKSLISKIPQSWKEFYDMVKGEASGKTVFVDSMGDVFVFPLKMLGYSINSVEKTELEEAQKILLDVAPHLYALESNVYGQYMKDKTTSLTLGWTGPLGQELKDEKAAGEAGYIVPSEGTLFWLDTWVMLADAPHPNAAYAWLNFIHEPEIQGIETNYNLYATPNDAAKEFVDPAILSDTAVFPPDDVIASLEGAQDTSGNNQRIDIWEEFKQAVGG